MRKKRVYAGKPVSIDVYNLTVEGRKVRRELIQHPGAAAILAFDENDELYRARNEWGYGPILFIDITNPFSKKKD